ncbi:MAG: Cys-tRNA(Pro) deacylase [Oscillospiraceae bacterium]|nr:Cys-tRNA(Pro) deacylase [Oscillospiraceae bacterium]
MRLLDQQGVRYESYCYEGTGAVSGAEVAAVLGQDPDRVFKTLVTEGRSGQHYVFVIPVLQELDLKKAAAAAGEKSIAMVKSKELLPLTGYIHGGCSPIGMKKPFPTFLEESAVLFDAILFSAGKIGYQVEVAPDELEKLVAFQYADLCE